MAEVIRAKQKFPNAKFDLLISSFPCIIASLRDYADFIPLKKGLFDLVVIDEASQVSIAQALPAILRAKKMIVLGDRRQFGNVKTSTASKEVNENFMNSLRISFNDQYPNSDIVTKKR